jgi:DNA-binding MarR family transcriptional regulator
MGTLTGLIREVRTCFNQLKSLSDQLNEGLGINASMRAVLEGLYGNEGRTVPDLARERGVSRQHVQTVMNALLDRNLVRAEDNPEHRKSALYVLTPKGDETFAEVRKREADPMISMASALSEHEMKTASALLARMNKELKTQIKTGDEQ